MKVENMPVISSFLSNHVFVRQGLIAQLDGLVGCAAVRPRCLNASDDALADDLAFQFGERAQKCEREVRRRFASEIMTASGPMDRR